jgi:hypothetical protein
MNKYLIKIIKSRLFNFVFTFSTWLVVLVIFYSIGILKNIDPNVFLLINLGSFFFSLTTSPATWIIKGFGIEIGTNTPNHFQVDKIVKTGDKEKSIIIRDYSDKAGVKEINGILEDLN